MKKGLAIIGSGRNLGNCESMAKEISRKISVPHQLQLQLLRLPEFDIRYCTPKNFCPSQLLVTPPQKWSLLPSFFKPVSFLQCLNMVRSDDVYTGESFYRIHNEV